MSILEELSPTIGAVGLIITAILAIIFYFQTTIDAQRKELSNITERLTKLELKNEYEKELKDLREGINELNGRLSDLQRKGN